MNYQHWDYFTFDGVKSDDYGVWISGTQTFAAPERDVEIVTVPGRNGALTLDNKRYKNVEIIYPCFMSSEFDKEFGAFKAAMLSKVGYLQLTDTYHPNGFRLARLTGGFEPETGIYNRSGQFEVTFDCYPQFYLSAGQEYTTVSTSGTTIENVTFFPAKPLVEVTFSSSTRTGTVTVGGETITITEADTSPIYLDSEEQNAYYLTGTVRTSQNDKIALTTGEFPTLTPGSNLVSWTGNISSVKVMPRWWTL